MTPAPLADDALVPGSAIHLADQTPDSVAERVAAALVSQISDFTRRTQI